MVINQRLSDWVQNQYFAGGLTYSGHPLACASAVASIEAFKEEGIVENSAAMGDYLARSSALAERHPSIGDVRGLGRFWGLELVKDRGTREPLVPFNGSGDAAHRSRAGEGGHGARPLSVDALERRDGAPPLTITREEPEEGMVALDAALSIADEFCF